MVKNGGLRAKPVYFVLKALEKLEMYHEKRENESCHGKVSYGKENSAMIEKKRGSCHGKKCGAT